MLAKRYFIDKSFYKEVKVKLHSLIVLISCLGFTHIMAQAKADSRMAIFNTYDQTYAKLKSSLLKNNSAFKDAVFQVENCYYRNTLDSTFLRNFIRQSGSACKLYLKNQRTINYNFFDTLSFLKNYCINKFIADTMFIKTSTGTLSFYPAAFNLEDPFGSQDFTNTFVSKLLVTNKGNCHSLAYLYKILADELGAKCWFALAPHHIYIKNYSEKIGWYNTELTSGTFPTDAWIMTSGYISPQAIRSGLYMDTLSNQQSIALCVLDLAKGYEFQTHNYYDGFILKCCDLVLQYHSVNPMALLLKAETLKKVYLKQEKEKDNQAQDTYKEMEKTYITLAKLGYREMPEKMYQQWLKDIPAHKNKHNKNPEGKKK